MHIDCEYLNSKKLNEDNKKVDKNHNTKFINLKGLVLWFLFAKRLLSYKKEKMLHRV